MKYCSQCGKEIKEGAKFCAFCGAAIKNRDGVNGTAATTEKRVKVRSIEKSILDLDSPKNKRNILQKIWPEDVSIILKCWIWILIIYWTINVIISLFQRLDTSSYWVISINHRKMFITLVIISKWMAILLVLLEIVAILVMLIQRKKRALHSLYGLVIIRVIFASVPGYILIALEDVGKQYVISQTITLFIVMMMLLIAPVVTTILTKKMKFFEN